MIEPAPHTSLSDRAVRIYAHIHQALLAVKVTAVVAILVGIVFVLVEVYAAIKHSSDTKQAQKIAQTTPQVVPDAPLKKPLFGRNEKPLAPHKFKPLPSKTGDPLPKPPAPDATQANPHPEVSTATAESGPVATVFDPESPKEALELSTKFGIDLDKYFFASQRKEIPVLENGASAILTIPAGGGTVEMHYVENKRPFFGFRPTFKIGGGIHRTWNDPQKTLRNPAASSQVQGFHLMAGLEPMRIGGMHFEVLTFLNLDQGREKPLNGTVMLNGYLAIK